MLRRKTYSCAQIGRSIVLVTKVLKKSHETETEFAQFHGNKTITIPIDRMPVIQYSCENGQCCH